MRSVGHNIHSESWPRSLCGIRSRNLRRGSTIRRRLERPQGPMGPADLISGFKATGDLYDGSVEGHNETRNLAGEKHLPCGTGCQPWQVGADLEASTRSAFWTRSHPG